MISFGGRNRINFASGLGAGGDEYRRDQEGWGEEKERSVERDNWNWKAFGTQCGSLI